MRLWGSAVRLGLESGRELNALTLKELRGLSEAFDEDFHSAITLEATLDCHGRGGGYGPAPGSRGPGGGAGTTDVQRIRT